MQLVHVNPVDPPDTPNNDKDQGVAGKITRNIEGTIGSYTHEITIELEAFASTGSDFKWKTFGAGGMTELVFNDSGNARLFHNDYSGGGGNVFSGFSIGFTDSDNLIFRQDYNEMTGSMSLSYSFDGVDYTEMYTGLGIEGTGFGDVITTRVEAEVWEFGEGGLNPIVNVDQWSLTAVAVPEPSSTALVGLGGVAMLLRRRRG